MTRILLMMMVFIATIGANANAETTNAVLAQVPFAKQPSATRYAAGQLRAEHIKALVDADVRRVIDLTTARETPGFDWRAAIEQAGMIYAALPIDGKGGLTRDNVRAFDALLSKAGEDITLVHCASANRVGALVALRAAWIDGATPEQAIAEGERWGLKGLRDTVALQLAERPTAGHAATARTPFP
ncbi:MAG: sulfur transferase domain-containing protein, partial [Dokdonella sp.]